MTDSPLLVVSDIDGTLIPNPYYSNISRGDHAKLCHKLKDLLERRPEIWLATGRTFETYAYLLKTFSGAIAYPDYFLGEFGSDVYRRGAPYTSLAQDPVLMECERIFTDLLVEMGYPEDLREGEHALEGVCLETKRRIMHVDWDLGSEATDRRVLEEFPERLKTVPEVSGLFVRVFEDLRRIDLCSPGFVPKVSVWERFAGLLAGKSLVWIFGDDAYDQDMFRTVKAMAPWAEVRFGSANPEIPGDRSFTCGAEVMDFIDTLYDGAGR